MSGEHFIRVRMNDDGYVLVGPRGQAYTTDEKLTDILSDVPTWIHRDRVGARKRGLLGWKSLRAVLASTAWTERVAEACDSYQVEVVRHVEVGPPGDERDALEVVALAPHGVSDSPHCELCQTAVPHLIPATSAAPEAGTELAKHPAMQNMSDAAKLLGVHAVLYATRATAHVIKCECAIGASPEFKIIRTFSTKEWHNPVFVARRVSHALNTGSSLDEALASMRNSLKTVRS